MSNTRYCQCNFLTGGQKAQLIAQSHAKLHGRLFFQGNEWLALIVRWPPRALNNFIARAQGLSPAQILLAVCHPAAILRRILARLD